MAGRLHHQLHHLCSQSSHGTSTRRKSRVGSRLDSLSHSLELCSSPCVTVALYSTTPDANFRMSVPHVESPSYTNESRLLTLVHMWISITHCMLVHSCSGRQPVLNGQDNENWNTVSLGSTSTDASHLTLQGFCSSIRAQILYVRLKTQRSDRSS
jgi:hypothetical protein